VLFFAGLIVLRTPSITADSAGVTGEWKKSEDELFRRIKKGQVAGSFSADRAT
jgi:hypothetical protein